MLERIKKGVRFDNEKKTFVNNAEWEEDDKMKDDDERIATEILKTMNSGSGDLEFTIACLFPIVTLKLFELDALLYIQLY